MLNILKLLLPAIIPSWNFFDIISDSPRIQFSLLQKENAKEKNWVDFRPRPHHLTFLNMLQRMIWNATWNETLFITSCAEQLLIKPNKHYETDILQRIINDLVTKSEPILLNPATHLQFRILTVKREVTTLQHEVAFYSRVQALTIMDVV